MYTEGNVPELANSQTQANLKEAFAGESQAQPSLPLLRPGGRHRGPARRRSPLRSVAEGETGHAFGHFDFLKAVGDPVTGVPVGTTAENLRSAIAGETYEYTEMYPGFARTAREEGFEDIAEWLETWPEPRRATPAGSRQGLESIEE